MKKYFNLLIVLVASNITLNAQSLWDDFETPADIVYSFTNGMLNQNFENVVSDVVNPSDTCARYARDGGQLYDVIVVDPNGIMLDIPSFTDSTSKMSMQVWSSNVGDTIQITLEDKNMALPTNFPVGRHSEYLAVTTVSGQWEEVKFTMSNRPDVNVPDATLNRMVILFAPNTNTNGIYLFDSLMGPFFGNPCDTVAVMPEILEDFECQRNMSYDFVNGDNIEVLNPLVDGVNGSDNCGKITKWIDPDLSDTINVPNDGAFGGKLNVPFTSADYKTVHISLYSPAPASDFFVIIRDGSDNTLLEKIFTTSSTTGWEEFKMDISSIPATTPIEGWVMLINPGTNTADSIYYDDFRISNDYVDGLNETMENKVSIYPNPATDIITISLLKEKISEVKIYSIDGVIQSTYKSNSNNVSCDISELSNGLYIVSIVLDNGQIITKKINK